VTDPNVQTFAGQVVLVTGGSRGIGRAVTLAFARQGADVTFCYRSDHAAAQQLCDEGKGESLRIAARQADVSRADEAAALVQQTVAAAGRLDVLVNNAGIFLARPVLQISDAEWNQVLHANLSSVFYCSRAALPAMIAQGGGAIVNIASIAGKRGSANHAHYAAAKGGVLAFTRSLAREVIDSGIRVNAVCPGRIATDLLLDGADDAEHARWRTDTPIRRLGTPDELAAAVLFLAGPAASYIVGETLDVDGGLLMD
jgi:3-oxoacyl-[acyl-carrier protein] reductase